MRCIDGRDVAFMLSADQLARVKGCSELKAGAHKWSMGTDQGHCLTLHVCAHEGTLSIVVL